jgi:Fe-S-cluster-containing dehydrogenase component
VIHFWLLLADRYTVDRSAISFDSCSLEGGLLGAPSGEGGVDLDRWVFMSDVCHHCTNAGCLDACPTGALIRTEFETVIVQPDICNGCTATTTAQLMEAGR